MGIIWSESKYDKNLVYNKKDESYNTLLGYKLRIWDLWYPTDKMIEIDYKTKMISFNTSW